MSEDVTETLYTGKSRDKFVFPILLRVLYILATDIHCLKSVYKHQHGAKRESNISKTDKIANWARTYNHLLKGKFKIFRTENDITSSSTVNVVFKSPMSKDNI
jgi:hypothetical protein